MTIRSCKSFESLLISLWSPKSDFLPGLPGNGTICDGGNPLVDHNLIPRDCTIPTPIPCLTYPPHEPNYLYTARLREPAIVPWRRRARADLEKYWISNRSPGGRTLVRHWYYDLNKHLRAIALGKECPLLKFLSEVSWNTGRELIQTHRDSDYRKWQSCLVGNIPHCNSLATTWSCPRNCGEIR